MYQPVKDNFMRTLLWGFGISLFLVVTSSIASYISIQNLLCYKAPIMRMNS